MSVPGVGLDIAAKTMLAAQTQVQPQQAQQAQLPVSNATSQTQEPNALGELLKGFVDGNSGLDDSFSGNQNELLTDNSAALLDDPSRSSTADAAILEKQNSNGNEMLVKAFDRSINMAAATLVVSGVSDTMRQLVRQQ